ncbi:rap guanine nucleotide exchange factor 6-like isoform X2 [Halichondria panicea]|uniref:rap guanine nucleotide exchange factor 6-like isoform X2 n=1 Tax=Halichondria panicea TaxID=6063 RepID=UPI00312B3C9A
MMSLEGDLVFTKRFVDCVKKPHSDRTPEDHDYICHTLKKLSEFEFYDSTQFKCVPDRLIYELHLKDTILYEAGALADCWYCVLTGSVMLSDTYLFSTGSSFGRCINLNQRDDRCHILEKTELLKINYSEEEMKRFAQRAAKMASKSPKASVDLTTSGEHSLSTTQVSTTAASTKAEDTVPPSGMTEGRSENVPLTKFESLLSRRKGSDGLELELHVATSTPPPDSTGSPRRTQVYPMSADVLSDRDSRSMSEERSPFFSFEEKKKSMSNDSLNKAMEHPVTFDLAIAGPTSSEVIVRSRDRRRERRASAPPTDHRIRDSVGSLDYLSESQVDSDDEESVQSESSSATSMDAVLEVLSKPPTDRSEEDIERVMDVLQYIPAFTNMTSNIRQALFQILMLQTFENEGSIVIDNGEEVDKWYVVLNGQLRLVRDSDTDRTYHVGDSFGINQSLKVLPQRGKLLTAEKSCTLCFVTLEEYSRVQIQGEENLKRVEVGGELVAVLEKRAVDAKREGYFIVQATPEELLKNLCEETVDDLFMKDFLLTYKTFLPSPLVVVDQLKKAWVEGMPEQRERVTVILTYWVAEQYSEFEEMTEMLDFLDWFEIRLVEDGKLSEKRTLDKLRSSRAATRSIELDRAGTNSPLEFEVVGGWEVGHPVFVSKVEPGSMSEKAGLRLGDQILEINDGNCIKKELNQVLSTLRKNYKLSLKVKSNLPEFRTFVADPPKVPADYSSKSPAPAPMVPLIPMARCNSDSKPAATNGKSSGKTPSSPKPKKKGPHIMKPLTAFTGKLSSLDKFRKFKLGPRSSSSAIVTTDSHDGTTGPAPLKALKKSRKSRKNSTENLSDGKGDKGDPLTKRAISMEDLHSLSSPGGNGKGGAAGKIVDAVVKLYLPDHSHKYLDISPSTTIADLISRSVKEFYPDKFVVSPSSEYCICMVTVDSRNGPIRNSVLPNHLTDLANYIGLGSRYYLKERAFHGTLVQDEEAEHIVKESRLWEHILSLSPKQVAEELTRADSVVFCSIDSREYIADLWRNRDQQAKQNLSRFENIPNDEMYWVVTMVVSETRSDMRAKLMKQFIKIARCCKDQRNYNSMFHILSGLHHGLVSRQKSSWEKVPSKHKKSMEDMSGFMNPFHNMAKYRELQRSTPPPLIPFFPIIKKDLTFLFDGNESQVKGLVNFEKLRMLARQIRLIKTYCQQPIIPDPPQVDLGKLGGMLKSIHHSIRLRNKSTNMATITDNVLKEVYTHHRMLKMVRKHLERKYVVQEEDLLERIAESSERVVQLRRNPPSPLNRVKRKSAPNDKYSNFNNFKPISPSPTTVSLGSDTSAAPPVDGFTPPSSPRRQLSVPASALASDSQSSSSVSVSPSLNDSVATEANGLVQAVQ